MEWKGARWARRQTLWPGRVGEEVACRATGNVNECFRWCVSTMVRWMRSSLPRASDCTVTTVRFHLDALCDEGAIVRTRMNRAGVGRPRTGYRAVEERLDYRVLAEVLAMELGQTMEERARRAQHAGQRWADRITVSLTR